MPVHFFNPPDRNYDFGPSLTDFVADIEASGEEIVGTQPYGILTAIFTRKSSKPIKAPQPVADPKGSPSSADGRSARGKGGKA